MEKKYIIVIVAAIIIIVGALIVVNNGKILPSISGPLSLSDRCEEAPPEPPAWSIENHKKWAEKWDGCHKYKKMPIPTYRR
ncbi:MAG: hypothetical protein WC319_01310 [Candidatus Paceibacterota bacterium]